MDFSEFLKAIDNSSPSEKIPACEECGFDNYGSKMHFHIGTGMKLCDKCNKVFEYQDKEAAENERWYNNLIQIKVEKAYYGYIAYDEEAGIDIDWNGHSTAKHGNSVSEAIEALLESFEVEPRYTWS